MKSYIDNDTIIKIICILENINLNNWISITENGNDSDSEFDKRFSLDRIYSWQQNGFRKRVRFVKYWTDGDYITVCISKMKISNITRNKLDDGNEVYFKGYSKDIDLRDIERTFKFKKIMKKMGK
jgi:hypothetical protein